MAPSPERAGRPEPSRTRACDGPEPAKGSASRSANFDGPFDLLLTLISKHELDITEVSLSKVTDEFIAYLRELDADEELDQASEFLVVAATLLDLKVAGLLPQGELVDAESVALLEARDLLFARLLQYRAFKEVSAWFARSLRARGPAARPRGAAGREVPRTHARAGLDAQRSTTSRALAAARVRAEGDPAPSGSTTCTRRW